MARKIKARRNGLKLDLSGYEATMLWTDERLASFCMEPFDQELFSYRKLLKTIQKRKMSIADAIEIFDNLILLREGRDVPKYNGQKLTNTGNKFNKTQGIAS